MRYIYEIHNVLFIFQLPGTWYLVILEYQVPGTTDIHTSQLTRDHVPGTCTQTVYPVSPYNDQTLPVVLFRYLQLNESLSSPAHCKNPLLELAIRISSRCLWILVPGYLVPWYQVLYMPVVCICIFSFLTTTGTSSFLGQGTWYPGTGTRQTTVPGHGAETINTISGTWYRQFVLLLPFTHLCTVIMCSWTLYDPIYQQISTIGCGHSCTSRFLKSPLPIVLLSTLLHVSLFEIAPSHCSSFHTLACFAF